MCVAWLRKSRAMTIRKTRRRGNPVLIVDILYRTPNGQPARYRRDAQVQTMIASGDPRWARRNGKDRGRNVVCNLQGRRRSRTQDEVRDVTQALDEAELRGATTCCSTRCSFPGFRSILRTAVDDELLKQMPQLPRLPRIGEIIVKSMTEAQLDKLMMAALGHARLAFGLAAHAGLRAREVRGLRWPDVGAPAPVVKALAGHSTLAVTQRYAHVTDEQLKEAIGRLRGNSVVTEGPDH
jgi:integrase